MIEELENIGLTNGEARVYLALLKHESSTAGPLVKESKVAYSKIYEVLQRLADKGLVSFIIKEGTRHYQATNPLSLKEFLERKEEEVLKSKEILNKISRPLSELRLHANQESAQMFFGAKGILTAYDIMLSRMKKGSEVNYFFSSTQTDHDEVVKFYIERPQFNNLAKKYYKEQKIIWKGIVDKGSTLDHNMPYMKLQVTTELLPGTIDITEDFVLITSWSHKPLGILIESKEVAKTYRTYFSGMWNKNIKKK